MRALALALGAAAALAGLGVWGVGLWIDYHEEPAPADLMVVLAGSFHRPRYAADLYHRGYAPELWLSRPFRLAEVDMLKEYGFELPREEDINRRILLKRGVPAERIHLYGDSVVSTADEALALGRAADMRGKRVLVVTSHFHARRAGLIFRKLLPQASVRVVATPYGVFPGRWWRDQDTARNAVLEMTKLAYFLAGGRFLSPAGN